MIEHDFLFTNKEERHRFYAAYRELAIAVSVSLGLTKDLMETFRNRANQSNEDHHTVALLLMNEFVESIDGVILLAERGSARNCLQLLRTAFEVNLSLRYLFEDKKVYRCRALAYEYFHKKSNLRWAEKCDPDSEVGKQLRAELAGDNFPDLFEMVGKECDTKAEAAKVKKSLNSVRYAEVRAELDRLKGEKKKVPNWFSLWNGPRTIRDMAAHLKLLSAYESMYCMWSSVTHGEAALRRIKGKSENGLAAR
jgi:hypothetical protein